MSGGCALCPRRCGALRAAGETGFCGGGPLPRVARAALHLWEEPPIAGDRGAGAVFFTGCGLRCVYCQNREISFDGSRGREMGPEGLVEVFRELEAAGAATIDLVTPSHFAGTIREALLRYKPRAPVVWNSSGYERVETLRAMEGLVDVYLPDFKYMEGDLAKALSGAEDYPEVCLSALREMARQVGDCAYDAAGVMTRGMLIRHLILPGHTRNSIAVFSAIGREFSRFPVSLMAQYTPPEGLPEGFPELKRRITKRELEKVRRQLYDLGLSGYTQERSAAGDRYLPDFHQFDGK